jgi:hypothetical protein
VGKQAKMGIALSLLYSAGRTGNQKPFFSSISRLVSITSGTIWAHEIDIFSSWKLVGPKSFHEVQRAHWRKLPYWILTPVGLALLGSIVLFWYHPANSPPWALWGVVLCQLLSIVLTVFFGDAGRHSLHGIPGVREALSSQEYSKLIGCGRFSPMRMQ